MMKCEKLTRRSILVLVVLSFVISGFAHGMSEEECIETLRKTSKGFSMVAKKAMPAVVSVRVEKDFERSYGQGLPFGYGWPFENDFFERFFGRPRRQPREREKETQTGQGSGFIISEDGYILTNNHVVGEVDRIIVTLHGGKEEYEAEVIGADPESDVAVIKIDAEDLPVIELGDSDELGVGEWVIAVGNPFGLEATVTVGVVSAKGRMPGIIEGGYEDFIQTDAAINPGNSGGPLLTLEGKAVGLSTAIFSRSGGYMGIGFAIPINMAKSVKEQLIKSGKVTRGYVGIWMDNVNPKVAEYFGLSEAKGIIVTKVEPDSPADKAGLKDEDIVLKLNGEEIEGSAEFRNEVSMMEPGTKVELTILRDGKEITKKVKIGSRDELTVAGETSAAGRKFGLQVQDLTEEIANRLGYEVDDGVLVSDVERGSAAWRAGIRTGMVIGSVNRKYVETVKEFNDAMEGADERGQVLLLVRHDGFSEFVVLTLEK